MERLLDHSRQLIFRRVGKSQCSIETVQALMNLTIWKRPLDQNGWMDIGIAIRMAYQLGLHELELKHGMALPSDEMERRVLAVS